MAQWKRIGLLTERLRVRIPPEAQVAKWIRLLAHNVKQGCSLRTHAFKNMRGLKRTWMTKRKSRGPETGRYPAFM